ncbi:hypothetical protein EDC04DRAFT_2606045 [Pisolithus marmoratus]|nr:hypothetical protein EDC04DRAFT_2606045 [Pisolithus marmoratus]
MAQLPPSLDLPQPMSGTLPIPSHPWALEGEYNFSGLLATMECGNMLQPNANSSMNWAPAFILPSASEHGCVASDSQPLSACSQLVATLDVHLEAMEVEAALWALSQCKIPLSHIYLALIKLLRRMSQIHTNCPKALITEGICDVSTWAMHNPDACIIQSHPPRQISEAQKASWAIAHEQRVTKKALLDKAMQEYLAQQASKMEKITLRHNVTVEYLKGIVGGETHYHSSQKVQQHNALLHAKALEVNADMPCPI